MRSFRDHKSAKNPYIQKMSEIEEYKQNSIGRYPIVLCEVAASYK